MNVGLKIQDIDRAFGSISRRVQDLLERARPRREDAGRREETESSAGPVSRPDRASIVRFDT